MSRSVVWEVRSSGQRLGYRKKDDVWVASIRNPDGTYTNANLGKFDEHVDAVTAAERWFSSRRGLALHGRATVEDACSGYVESRRLEGRPGAAADIEARLQRIVRGTFFGRLHLDALVSQQCLAFRNSLVQLTGIEEDDRARKSTANRNWACVRAALNWAFRHGMTTSKPWEAVTPFAGTHRRREGYLNLEQRHTLLNAVPPDTRRFLKAMLLTACRPGELFAADVADFDRTMGTLAIRKSKTKARVCTLSTSACEFMREITRDRIGNQPLLQRDVPAVRKGNALDYRFDKEYLKVQVRRAVKSTNLPAETVAYCCRHTAISEMMLASMDSTVIALLAGTSTDMIERHYGHLGGERLRAALDQVQMI